MHVRDSGLPPELDQPRLRPAPVELPDAAPQEASDVTPTRRDDPPGDRQAYPNVELPGQPPDAAGKRELEPGHRPARPDDACQFAQRRRRIGHVTEEIGEGQRVERVVWKGERFGRPLDEPNGRGQTLPCHGQHLGALVEADHLAAFTRQQLAGDGAGPCGDVEHRVARSDIDLRDEESPPPCVLAEGENGGVAVVRRPERGEQRPREGGLGHAAESILGSVGLVEDVGRIATAAASHAGSGEEVTAVLPIEPVGGERLYLCAFEGPAGLHTWLALDENGDPVTDRRRIRDAASIAALVEVAEESAVVSLDGEPRVASAAYLDSLGATAQTGEVVGALHAALPAVEELTRDVELHYRMELT